MSPDRGDAASRAPIAKASRETTWLLTRRLVPCVLTICVAACASTKSPSEPPSTPLGRDIPAYSAPERSVTMRGDVLAEEPSENLTLADAVAFALLHNPALQSSSWEIRAREAARLQTGLLPNPGLDTESEDLAGSGRFSPDLSQPQTTVRLSQLVELGGDRGARARVSALSAELAAWDYEATRLDVLTRTTQAFVAVLGAQDALQLAEESVTLSRQVANAVAERAEAGKVSMVEKTRAEVAAAGLRVERDAARRLLDAARARVAVMWGGLQPRFRQATGTLPSVNAIPSADAIQARLANNPDLARWETELARREASVALERARAIPDVTVSAGYRKFHDTDNNALVVGAAIPLPLFDRNQGALAEARYRLAGASGDRRATAGRLHEALADAYRALATAHDEATLLANDVLPGAEHAYQAAQEGYRLGKFGLLDVLDAQRTLFAARAQRIRALVAFHTAAAEVERLIAEPLNAAAQGGR